MTKRLTSENLRLKTRCFYSTLAYVVPEQTQVQVTGPFLITKVFLHGAVELENKEGEKFMVNGQRIKIYLGHEKSVHEVVEKPRLDEV